MRTHDIFGESRTLTVNVFRLFQPTEERKQSFAATIFNCIGITTVLGIFIDIHVSYPADTPTRPKAGTNANTMLPIIPNIRAGIRNIP